MAKILIVDDQSEAALVLAALLEREGHVTAYAQSAGAALTWVRENEPDLILLDLTMPHVDGLDLLEALTDDERFAHLRVAVYSGRDDPLAVESARRMGARDFIHKGSDWQETYRRIRACLATDEDDDAGAAGAPNYAIK